MYIAKVPRNLLLIAGFLTFMFHKVVWQHTYARSGGKFHNQFTTSLPRNPPENWKSVKIWRNYGNELVASLFWPKFIVS